MDERELIVMENQNRACQGKMEVPTEKEREALAAMKSIKERVRDLKRHLGSLDTLGRDQNAGEILTVENELARLKVDWNRWEEERKAAAKERMIILGHEEGPI